MMNLASEMQFEVENPSCSNMEIDEFEDKIGPDSSDKGDESKTSNVIFSRENPLISKKADDLIQPQSSYSLSESPEKKMYRYGRNQLGRQYHLAIISHNWDMAESLVTMADVQTLNHMLCMTLDFVWFLNTRQDLCRITGLIKGIVKGGASDYMRAMLRTAFLASCVSAYQSNLIGSGEGGNALSQKLKDRLKEYHGDDFLKAEASQKVQKFMEWALACISFHYRRSSTRPALVSWVGSRLAPSGAGEVQLRLSAFKFFLDLAGDSLSGKDFTEAFDAACFPLTLFSSLFDPGWSSGAPAAMIQGLLGLLVEWGADNVNQCFLEAARFGSTELVRILLQIARDNSLDVDVDLALGFASHYCRIGTMECLVEEGNATSFLGPLMRAAERGCMTVVRWFVSRDCRDMELCLALTGAASAGKLEVVSYLLPHVPQSVLTTLSVEILKSAGERTNGSSSFEGVDFLLKSDFLRDAAATYAVANSIACSDDKSVVPALREFLRENWSEAAFKEALRSGEEHFLNLVRVYARGGSEILLRDLPAELVAAIGYLPLYRECACEGGELLPQKTRGYLVSVINNWRHWEHKIQQSISTDDPNAQQTFSEIEKFRFIQEHYKGFGKAGGLYGWLTHCSSNMKFNFYKYMMRALEADFKKVVGISWYLWTFVMLFLLLNVYGWHIYFWVSWIPLVLLLVVGAKLEHIITELAHEVAEKHTIVEGNLIVTPSDDLFWFHRPKIVLVLIHFILFQNAFEIAYFFWILTTYGLHSCIMGKVVYLIPRLIISVITQVLCSYSTLPLYAIVSHMGSSFKRAIFEEHVQAGLLGWAEGARRRKGKGAVTGTGNGGVQMTNVPRGGVSVEQGTATLISPRPQI